MKKGSKSPGKYPKPYKAFIVAQADFLSRSEINRLYSVDRSTVWRWIKESEVDPEMQQMVANHREEFTRDVAADITKTIKVCLQKIQELVNKAETVDQLAKVCSAYQTVGALKSGDRYLDIIDGRLNGDGEVGDDDVVDTDYRELTG